MTSATQDDFLAQCSLESYLPSVGIDVADDLHIRVTDPAAGDEAGAATVVAFRGTANVQGWHRNFTAWPKSHPILGYCHEGFLAGAAAIMQRLDLAPDLPTIFTGHSLGGALAVLAAALRVANGGRVDEVVTFGSPRAGYLTLRAILAAVRVRQYRRGNDPVPLVPLDLLVFPFKHVSDPLIQVGVPQAEEWRCHAIEGYVVDVRARRQATA